MNCVEKVTDQDLCIACGLCAGICKHDAIVFRYDNAGFEYADIDSDKCVGCGLCRENCVANHKLAPNNLGATQGFAGYYEKKEERIKSTSGGICNALSEYVLKKNGYVFGVRYSDDFQTIEYQCISRIDELDSLRGVKYAQANHMDFSLLKSKLDTGNAVLVVGLPCLITAVNEWGAHYENLYTIALICHGPTSRLIHRRFLEKHARGDIRDIILRKKIKGRQYLTIEYKEGGKYKKIWGNTTYSHLFSIVLRESCYKCKYRLSSVKADMIAGDYWGLEDDKEFYSYEGNSAIILLTHKWGGVKILKELDGFRYKEKPIEDILKKNPALLRRPEKSKLRENVIMCLNSDDADIDKVYKKTVPRMLRLKARIRNYVIFFLPRRTIRAIRSIMKKQLKDNYKLEA